jgi:hypothetical protein
MAPQTPDAVRSLPVSRNVRSRCARGGLLVAALAAAAVTSVFLDSGPQRTVEAAGEAFGAGGEFHAVEPSRILDSRKPDNDVAPAGRKPSNTLADSTTFDVPVLGRGGVPEPADVDQDGFDDSVLAVVVSITVIDPTKDGYLRAFPTGAVEDTTSVVNFRAGPAVPNSAILRPGDDGKISIRLVTAGGEGSAHVAIDISGWFSTSQYTDGDNGGRGARLIPIPPIRAYDSDLPQFGSSTLGARSQTSVPIRGAVDASSPGQSIPDDPNIRGVVVNVTGQNRGSAVTYLSALPERIPDDEDPETSTVNLQPGLARANLAILPVGADGSITLFNFAGEVRLVVDIMGYLVDGTPVESQLGRVIPLVGPYRSFDTRQPEFGQQPLGPGKAEDWSFQDFVNDVKIDGDPVGPQIGLLGNLTATGLKRQYPWAAVSTYLTAYPTPPPPPDDQTPPEISNLNLRENEAVPNLALLTYGASGDDSNQLRFFNRAGYVDYLLDVYAVVLAADPVNG